MTSYSYTFNSQMKRNREDDRETCCFPGANIYYVLCVCVVVGNAGIVKHGSPPLVWPEIADPMMTILDYVCVCVKQVVLGVDCVVSVHHAGYARNDCLAKKLTSISVSVARVSRAGLTQFWAFFFEISSFILPSVRATLNRTLATSSLCRAHTG